MKRILLLDMNYLCFRAFYSTGSLRYEASPTGMLYGVFRALSDLTETFQPDRLAFCFDSRYSVRKKIYSEYKSNRKIPKEKVKQHEVLHNQIEQLRRKYLVDLGFKNVLCQKGYEADDLIASLCQTVEGKVTIVSADKDLFQCLGRNIRMWNPTQKKMTDQNSFRDRYDVYPVLWNEVKAITGCSSDNIKGIDGVGEKTAIKFVKGVLNHKTKTYKWITRTQHIGIINRNMQLVRLPFEGTKTYRLVRDKFNRGAWKEFCKKLGFRSLISSPPRCRRK